MFYIRVITCGIKYRVNMIKCSSKPALNFIPALVGFLCSFLLAYVGDCRVKKVKEFVISLG